MKTIILSLSLGFTVFAVGQTQENPENLQEKKSKEIKLESRKEGGKVYAAQLKGKRRDKLKGLVIENKTSQASKSKATKPE